ncbi:hypothetical protein EAE99_004316 [Botrytis elliptica]|nr:hypothetical protein EAE99_004316 [Botrytis elliptica]
MNVMKELAFSTTTAGDEAVDPDPIDSAVIINLTFADRDTKTINEIQLQEGAELLEITKLQNIEPRPGVFDQPAIVKQDETEEEIGLDRLAVISNVPYPSSIFKMDWEYARMNKDEQWEFLNSICVYWETFIEPTQPQIFLRKFNCFPKLPLEMRRTIWFYALPEPRLVELHIFRESDHVLFSGGSELVSAEIWRDNAGFVPSQLLLVCRESHDLFLEHYSIMDLQSLPGDEVISDATTDSSNSTFHASSSGYIDNKSDTLVIRDLHELATDLLFFNMHLNLIFFDPNNGRGIFGGLPSHLWKDIETLFPHLKQLTFIENTCRNDRSVDQGELDFNPLSINCLHPVNADTISSLVECVAKVHYRVNPEDWVQEPSFTGQLALDSCIVYKSQYLDRVQINPSYWGGIEFETSILINFQPDHDFYIINRSSPNQKDPGGNPRSLITRSESCRGTISLYFDHWKDNLPVYYDGSFYKSCGEKEQHEGYESATRYDYDKWPWNDLKNFTVRK